MSIIANPNNRMYRGDVSGYLNAWAATADEFIAGQILPALPVDAKQDFFYKREPGGQLKAPDGTRAPGDTSKRDTAGLVQDTYACAQHRLEAAVPVEYSREYSKWGINWINIRAMDKAQELRRGREKRVADALFNITNYPLAGTTGLDITNEWDDGANAVPIDNILAGSEAIYAKCGRMPNTLILADITMAVALGMCKQIRESLGLRYSDSANDKVSVPVPVLLQTLAPWLTKLVVGKSFYNSTPNAASPTISRVWSQEYAGLAVTSDGGSDITETCLGRMMTYADEGGEFEADSYYENDTQQDVVGVQDCTAEKIFLEECFFLFGNVKTI